MSPDYGSFDGPLLLSSEVEVLNVTRHMHTPPEFEISNLIYSIFNVEYVEFEISNSLNVLCVIERKNLLN